MAPISRLANSTRYERGQCGNHHWCHLCRLYQVGAGFAGLWNLHWDGVPSEDCQGTLALCGLDSPQSARKGYPCEAGLACFALSNWEPLL